MESLMVVDDNPGDVELCRIVLGGSGHFPEIYTAADGEEALDFFLRHEESRALKPGLFPPALMPLDIRMPKVDGFAFLEELRKIRDLGDVDFEPSIVVMLTSSSDPADRERAEATGMVADYLVKPPTPQDAARLAERFGKPAPRQES